ncbi:MAG: hypothetical protein H5T61_08840 [Thermoflexales bacterium]|nr:hypothetical protein [Thermoflexales bacterium]
MLKAGGIGAAVGFVVVLILTLITPLCNPGAALFIGLGAGILAAFWEHPATGGDGALKGAEAGAIAMTGGLLGEMVGAVLNGIFMGPERVTQLARQLGLPLEYPQPAQYWAYLLGGNCCCALLGVLLGAGLGAVGGLIGHQIWGRSTGAGAEPGPSL